MQNLSYSTNSGGNRAIVFGQTVVNTCNEGYFVDFSEEQFQFDAKCSEEGEFTNVLECLPADCRAAPDKVRKQACTLWAFSVVRDCGAPPRRNHSTVGNKAVTARLSVQPSVRTVMMALEIFVDRTASVRTRRHQRAFIWMTTRAIATLVSN